MKKSVLKRALCCSFYLIIFLSAFSNCNNFTVFNEPVLCLTALNQSSTPSSDSQFLRYPDGRRQSIRIPILDRASARIAANIAHILLHEVMGYSAILIDLVNLNSEEVVNYVAGCSDGDDPDCVQRDIGAPTAHFSVETWKNGQTRASSLPDDIRPKLLQVQSYSLSDGWFLWQDTLDRALGSAQHLSLDHFRAYNRANFNPAAFFDPYTRIFDLLPDEAIVRCADMGPNGTRPRPVDAYVRATNDSGAACAHGGAAWLSPACRAATGDCVPLLLVDGVDRAMQVAAPPSPSESFRVPPSPSESLRVLLSPSESLRVLPSLCDSSRNSSAGRVRIHCGSRSPKCFRVRAIRVPALHLSASLLPRHHVTQRGT